jgi:hypothetical protein
MCTMCIMGIECSTDGNLSEAQKDELRLLGNLKSCAEKYINRS